LGQLTVKKDEIFVQKYIFTLVMSVLLISCATKRPEGKTEEEILYKEALSFVESENYILAADKLREIKARFPYSTYAREAQLKLADISFEQENFIEAAVNYQSYKDLYPGDDKMSYVVFRLGESFYEQLPPTFDRDLSESFQAIAYYKQVIKRYPNSEYVEEAKKKIKLTEDMLRSKEKYIADFYFKTEVFEAARYRYKQILQMYEDEELLKHSMLRAVESSLKLKEKDNCSRDAEVFLGVLGIKEAQTRTKLRNLKQQCEAL
jgi:outer membrane protein assembly factor BamD